MAIRERVEIVVRERGARTAGRNIRNIGDHARRSAIQTHRLRSALVGLATAFGAFAIVRIVDQYTSLQNRLKVVTQNTGQLAVVTKELFDISKRNRVSVEGTGILYQRMAVTLRDLGVSATDGLELIDTLSKGVAISGATAAEARGAMIQFSQALSNNFTASSQELNSLLEQTPIIVDAIAKELGIARGQVKQYAQDGKVSSEIVIRALRNIRGEWVELFARTTPTIESAFTVLRDSFTQYVGEVDSALGISEKFARGILALSDNIDTFAKIAAIAAGTITTLLLPAMAKLAVSYTFVLALRRPFAAIAAAIVAAGIAAVAFGDKIKVAEGSLATVRDVALVVWDDIKIGVNNLWQSIKDTFPAIGDLWGTTVGGMELNFKNFVTFMARGLQNTINAVRAAVRTLIETWQYFPRALLEVTIEAVQRAWQAIQDFASRVGKRLQDVVVGVLTLDWQRVIGGAIDPWVESASGHIADTFLKKFEEETQQNTQITDYVAGLWQRADERAAEAADNAKKELEKLEAARAELSKSGERRIGNAEADSEEAGRKRKSFADYLAELQREQELGTAVGETYKVLNAQLEIANKLRRDLTDAEKLQIEEQVLANEQLERQRTLLEEIRGPHEEFRLNSEALTTLFQDGKISIDEYNSAMNTLRQNFVQGLPEATTFADGFSVQIGKMQAATANGMAQIGTQVAQIFGPGGTLINGIGDAVAQTLVFGKSFKDQIRQVAQSIISQLISSLVKVGLNMVLNATLGQGLMAGSTAAGVAQAGALTAAYTPAAAMASLATGGANAAAAGTGITSIFGILASLAGSLFGSFGGFREGGFTGAIGTREVAGVVHGQEFVINAAATKRHRSLLEAINAGKDPDMAVQAIGPAPQPVSVNVVNEIPDAAYEARALSEGEIEIIAKRVVRREAPETVANDLRNPNSRTSKAISNNTTASRKRA